MQGADRCTGQRTRRYDTAINIDGSDDRALTSQQAVGNNVTVPASSALVCPLSPTSKLPLIVAAPTLELPFNTQTELLAPIFNELKFVKSLLAVPLP